MATLDFSLRLDQLRGKVSVNSILVNVDPALALNVNFVSFAKGQGSIIYNDRVGLPELFTDPSPYQTQVNAWLFTMSIAPQPITLAQAKLVKIALINAIYSVKRQVPVTVTVSGTPRQWDASDIAVARMSAISGASTIDAINSKIGTTNSNFTILSASAILVAQINAVLATLNSQESANLTTISAGIATLNSLMSQLTTFQGTLNVAELGVTGWVDPGPLHTQSPASGVVWSPLSGVSNNSSTSSISNISAPTLQLLPVGATALVTLTPTDMVNITAAIAAQNSAEALVNAQKQAAVNAMSDFLSVINYDATTGW